jgi:alkanesulfonate monooxygenase SsuD/methylene tetrahydromethanopterin reductase-like flavin-dependent oxidoreductase (luciferase family)
MKAGVVYPQIELGGDTGAVKAFAQAAEDLGYDDIVIYDHVSVPFMPTGNRN